MTNDDYDWRQDAYASWLLALEELHRAAVKAGRIKERYSTDDEAWLEANRVDPE
jgi:hypothetical protein